MIQIMNIIMMNAILLQQKVEQIFYYLIDKMNLILIIYLYVKIIAHIMDTIVIKLSIVNVGLNIIKL